MVPPRGRAGAPGSRVDVGGHRLHLHCAGSGSPAVIFDAALGASSLSWSLVHPRVAAITTACAYDRGGFGWSDAGPLPRTVGRLADELRHLLDAAGIRPPYVLVGHSFGGLVARVFASRYAEKVGGMVLVDPAHPEEWLTPDAAARRQIDRGVRLCRYGHAAARAGLARVVALLVALGALTPARAAVKLISRGGLSRADEEILAPMWKLPQEARRPLARFWTRPAFFEALGSQIESICTSAGEVLQAEIPRHIPLVVLSTATASPARLALHEQLATRSSRGLHRRVERTGHWIPLDRPDVVAEVVVQMVNDIRQRGIV